MNQLTQKIERLTKEKVRLTGILQRTKNQFKRKTYQSEIDELGYELHQLWKKFFKDYMFVQTNSTDDTINSYTEQKG